MIFSSLPPHIDPKQVDVLVFDKDNTLTPPNKPLENAMASRIAQLSHSYTIVLLTARDIEVCKKHILEPLDDYDYHPDNLVFGCCNGAEIFVWDRERQDYVQKHVLPWILDPKRFDEATNRMNALLGRSDVYYEPRGSTMLAFVCIPRASPEEERRVFDPDKKKRIACINAVRDIFSDSYEMVPGGSTSIDVALYNKADGMEHLRDILSWKDEAMIVFFGDNFWEYGNDAPIAELDWVISVSVANPTETLIHLESF